MSEIISYRIAPVLGPVTVFRWPAFGVTVFRWPAFGMLALLLLLLAPGLRAKEGETPPRTSLQAFAALYAQVETAAAEGRLPAGAAAAAEELAFDLKTELIRRDAEIEVLKLEAARFDGERQQQALDRLVATAAARERRVIEHIRRLEALSGVPAAGVSAAAAPAETLKVATAEPAAGDAESNDKNKLNITFEAEDLIEDPDP